VIIQDLGRIDCFLALIMIVIIRNKKEGLEFNRFKERRTGIKVNLIRVELARNLYFQVKSLILAGAAN
jgi:hypothetical protein